MSTNLYTDDGELVSSTNPLPTTEPYASLNTGAKTVASAGTAEALAGSTTARLVAITTNSANTGRIAIGDNGVVASTDGMSLGSDETVVLPVPGDNLVNLFIDATVNGEGVKFTYFN